VSGPYSAPTLRLVRSHLKQNVPCIFGDFVGITTPRTQSVAEKKIHQLVVRGETTRMSIMNISISLVIHKLHFTHFKFNTIVQANKMVESVVVFCPRSLKREANSDKVILNLLPPSKKCMIFSSSST
jgi:hypothetical protein